MKPSQDQSVAVVAGGTSGIGRATVRRLHAEGFRVAYFGSSAAHLRESEESLEPSDNIFGAQVDVREPAQISAFFNSTEERFGAVSALVYASAISPKKEGRRVALHRVEQAEWLDVLSVNLTGALHCCQCVLPGMMLRNYGRMVMIGSIAARAAPRFAGTAYVASKAGLAGLTRALAAEYAADGITANTVSPGNIATSMTGDVDSPQNREAAQHIPAGRVGLPEDLSGLIAFLCSPEAAYINGATIDVTGAEFVAP